MGAIFPILIGIIIFVSVFLLLAVFSGNIEKILDPILGRYLKNLEKEFELLDIPMTARAFMMFQIGLTVLLLVAGLLLMDEILSKVFVGLTMGVLGFFGSRMYITQSKNKRKILFDEQFVDTIALIANAVRSGLSLMQALELAVTEMGNPMAYEVNLVIQSTRVGVPLDVALTEWSKRMDSKDLDIFVTAIIIQNQTGGNLSEILETLGKTIRERFKIHRQIKSLTAQGVMSAYVLTGLPIVLGIALYIIQPETMGLLFTTNYGIMLVVTTFSMIGIGGFFVKKIITIDV